MKIKYFGTEEEKGLTLTATIFDKEGELAQSNIPMTETFENSAIYRTEDITGLSRNLYITRIINSQGEFLGHSDFIWDGVKEITLADITNWSKQEQKEIRDALGISGDKSVAKGGQLQKKSEYPYNSTIDTNDIYNE